MGSIVFEVFGVSVTSQGSPNEVSGTVKISSPSLLVFAQKRNQTKIRFFWSLDWLPSAISRHVVGETRHFKPIQCLSRSPKGPNSAITWRQIPSESQSKPQKKRIFDLFLNKKQKKIGISQFFTSPQNIVGTALRRHNAKPPNLAIIDA